MTKRQKLTLILTLTLSLVFVVFVSKAFAVDIGGAIMAVGLTATVGWIFELVMQLLGLGIWFGGAIFDMFLSWGNFLGESKDGGIPIIVEAWKIIRDFVNVSFIFVLLTIAISTILGIERYGIKALFAQLIIIALLVNFSLVLVRVVLDTSNLVTNFFIKGSGVDGFAMSQKLVGSLGIQKVWSAAWDYDVGAGGVASTFLISMIMGIVVLLATLIVIWLAAGLLVVRIIVLAFVAIFAPAAFLCRVIPGAEKYWQKWWTTLINWALFTPAFAFFLYLAMRTADTFSQIQNLDTTGLNYQAAVSSFFSLGNNLIQYILVLGFTLGGLLMAKEFGVQGGAKVYGWAQAGLKKASGYTDLKKWASKTTKDQWRDFKNRAAPKIGDLAKRFPKWAYATPLAPALLAGRAIGATAKPGQYLAQQRADIAEEKKKLEHMASDDLAKQLKTASGKSLAAVIEELAKRGDLDDKRLKANNINAAKIQNIFKDMEKAGGNIKDILRHRPDLALQARDAKAKDYDGLTDDQAIEKAIKLIKPEQASNISGDALTPDVVEKFLTLAGPAHLEEIARKNIPLMNSLQPKIILANNAGQLQPRIANYINSQLGQGLGWHL